MDFQSMMRGLRKGAVSERTNFLKQWHDKGGIYAIWGNAELKRKLTPQVLELHASKQNRHKVILNMRKGIKRSIKRKDLDGKELFCFYVGKTAHLKKRMTIQRYEKVLKLLDLESKKLKEMLRISFCEMSDWEERFYAEGYAIAILLPVLNAQPER